MNLVAKDKRNHAASATIPQMFAEALQHHRAGRLTEAERLYRQVLRVNGRHADSLHLLGMVAYQSGRHDVAADLISQAIAIDARPFVYHCNLGLALKDQGRLDEAVVSFRKSIELNPDDPNAHNNLGLALNDLWRLDEAVASYSKAIELSPACAEVHYNLAIALKAQGRLDEAAASNHKAIELKPDNPAAYNNLGTVLQQQGHLDEAITRYHKAVELNPDYATAHNNLAIGLLAQGHLKAGWEEQEWRWKTPEMCRSVRNFPQPQWRGEPAQGQTLLIHAEQGFGDTIQFCRYAALAAASGLLVIMEVPKPLIRLLRGLPGVHLLVASGEELPPFDCHCPMLSLPLAFGTTLATIPSAAFYLRADPVLADSWRSRLAAMPNRGRRVGLVWAGNPRSHLPAALAIDRRRSLAPGRLAPLFQVPRLQFFSLQKVGVAPPAWFPLSDFMDEMADFADTAALVANLDLVISVDSAVAHLAAALGKPVWLLDRFDPCWRWLTGRRDSPWYPTLRIYRQPGPGEWDPVVAEVARDLRALLSRNEQES